MRQSAIRRGLVTCTEDAGDRRRSRVALTPSGCELIGRLDAPDLVSLASWLRALAASVADTAATDDVRARPAYWSPAAARRR
ncbi:MAG TPA: hypothetical protein VHB98_18615 [Chloroflexota bacterium]|nr:hypothetical protein [Chloroflexota bacterium]